MHVYTHVCMHVCTHVYMHVCTHVCMHVCCMHVYTHVCTHVCMHVYTHVCTHVYTHVYTRVYTHVYTACPANRVGEARSAGNTDLKHFNSMQPPHKKTYHMSIHMSTHMSRHMSTYMSIHMSVRRSNAYTLYTCRHTEHSGVIGTRKTTQPAFWLLSDSMTVSKLSDRSVQTWCHARPMPRPTFQYLATVYVITTFQLLSNAKFKPNLFPME